MTDSSDEGVVGARKGGLSTARSSPFVESFFEIEWSLFHTEEIEVPGRENVQERSRLLALCNRVTWVEATHPRYQPSPTMHIEDVI